MSSGKKILYTLKTFSGRRGGYKYAPEATALFARMSAQPDTTRKKLINKTIVDLKTAGIWDKLDCLWITAAHTEQAALLNWVKNEHGATAVNGISFIQNKGFKGDGLAKYLNSNFIPSIHGVKHTRTSACLGFYSLDDRVLSAQVAMGVNDGSNLSYIQSKYNSDTTRVLLNSNGVGRQSPNSSTLNNIGLFSVTRTGTTMTLYNNLDFYMFSQSITELPTKVLALMAYNNNGSYSLFETVTVPFFYVGGYLTNLEILSLKTIMLNFLNKTGAI